MMQTIDVHGPLRDERRHVEIATVEPRDPKIRHELRLGGVNSVVPRRSLSSQVIAASPSMCGKSAVMSSIQVLESKTATIVSSHGNLWS